MKSKVTSLSLIVLLSGCMASGAKSVKQGMQESMSVLVYGIPTGAEPRLLQEGGRLHSGDRFAVKVELGEPAYVYLLHASEGQSPIQIYPPPGSEIQPETAKMALHLPKDGKEWTLDNIKGQERLYVIAAPFRLGQTQLQEQIQTKAVSLKEEERGRGDPPPEMNEKNRGEAQRLRALKGPDGISMLRFWFQHE